MYEIFSPTLLVAFFQVQGCLKIYSCSSCDATSLFNVRLACVNTLQVMARAHYMKIFFKNQGHDFYKPCYHLDHALLSLVGFYVLKFKLFQLLL